jgi:hypothetical protein
VIKSLILNRKEEERMKVKIEFEFDKDKLKALTASTCHNYLEKDELEFAIIEFMLEENSNMTRDACNLRDSLLYCIKQSTIKVKKIKV